MSHSGHWMDACGGYGPSLAHVFQSVLVMGVGWVPPGWCSHVKLTVSGENGVRVWAGGTGAQWGLDGVGLSCFCKGMVRWAGPPLVFQSVHFHSSWTAASPWRRQRGEVNWFCAVWSCIVNAINRKFAVNGVCLPAMLQLWRLRLLGRDLPRVLAAEEKAESGPNSPPSRVRGGGLGPLHKAPWFLAADEQCHKQNFSRHVWPWIVWIFKEHYRQPFFSSGK